MKKLKKTGTENVFRICFTGTVHDNKQQNQIKGKSRDFITHQCTEVVGSDAYGAGKDQRKAKAKNQERIAEDNLKKVFDAGQPDSHQGDDHK